MASVAPNTGINQDAPKTLTDQAYSQLRAGIIHGHLKPSSKLRIEHLRREYGVGASPLREALSRLTADGFVTVEGQRGFRVAPMSIDDLEDITELRITLELQALRQSIARGDDNWEASIVAAFYRLSKSEENPGNDINEWERRNHDFHTAVISACTSKWLIRFYTVLYDQHKRYRNIALHTKSIPRDLHREHQRIYETVLERDVEKACAATEAHIRRTAEITRQVLLESEDHNQTA